MKKRFVSLLLAIGMILSLMPVSAVTAFAGDPIVPQVKVGEKYNCGKTRNDSVTALLTQNNGDSENPTYTLNISGQGEMKNCDTSWDGLDNPWGIYRDQITELTIDEGITSIGAAAFYKCSNLKGTLTIPSTVTVIGESAFNGCESLTGNLTIPNTVTEVGKYAFQNCSGFRGALSLSKSLKEICSGTFSGCSGLTGSLTIPEKVTKIGICAFRKCEHLTGDLTIPDTVTEVGDSAFEGCSGFNGTIHISKKLKEIKDATFKDCSRLMGDLIIPDGVTTIAMESFYNCSNLTGELDIPDSVKVIGGGYSDLYFPTQIWKGAFEGCKGFTALKLSNSLTCIPEYAFDGCSGLEGTLTIPESVTEIGYCAFQGCKKLTGPLTIPNQVEKIGKSAFAGCTGLTGDLTIPENVTTIEKNAFYDCGFTGSVDLSQAENLKVIDEGTFMRCENLKKVYLSKHITAIKEDAFNWINRIGTAKIYYPAYKEDWLTLAENVSDLNDDKNAFISGFNPMPVCYYCDVTFDPKGGTFADNTTAKTYQKIYRTELVATNAANTSVPEPPTRTDYTFNGWYYLDANQKVPFNPATDGVPDTMTLYADWTQTGTTATVAISGITAGQELIKGKEYPFTVTVTPHVDTGAGELKFELSQNAELWYKNTEDQWEKVDNNTLNIDFGTTEYQFKLVPKESGANTLTVGVQKDGMTTGAANKDSVSFTVRDPKAAEIAIADLNNQTIKQNKPHTFTVTVTANDDSGNATLTFDNVAGLTYNGTAVTDAGVTVALTKNQSETLNFTLTPSEAGNKILTATLSPSGAMDTATYTVSEYEHAKVTIDGLDTDLKQGESKDFTVKVDPKDDRGDATIDFGNKNSEIQYKDGEDWKSMPSDGLKIDLNNGEKPYDFRITPKNDGSQTLTATVKKDNTKLGEAEKSYNVSKYVDAVVKIDGLSGTVETDTEKEFTVTVTANDDAGKNVTAKAGFTGPAGATITLKKVQYRFGDSGEWQDGMQELNGMNLDINSLKLPFNSLPNITYKLTVTFAEAGNYKFDVSLTKAAAAEAFTSDSAEVTVTKKEEPVTPGGGSTGGGENPGENPGGGSTGDSGNTKPTPKPDEKPDRKIKIDGGIVEVNGKEVKPDEDGNITVKKGDEITVTVDKSKISDAQVFDQWVIKPDSVLNEVDPKSEKISFTMPAEDVTIEAMTRDASIEDDGPGILGTGALIATGVVGSAALLYQGHMLGTELYLRYLLPHGAVIPQNRAELAVLLWQDAENPEPVSTTLYSDISDEDSAIQQAARWAVENDLMEQLDADEHPDHFDPFVPVTFSDSIRAWKKAQELKKSVH